MQPIDIVITYVDGNDPEWQRKKNEYTPGGTSDINPNRYREWNNLQYLFRGIEAYAPWVRKIHFVTCGHLPSWLSTEHPKLHIVRHEDYIPAKWLPTFNNRCIELNLHRIPDLTEQFVYFNDDMFLTAPVKPEDFFLNGKPRESAVLLATNYRLTDGIAIHLAPTVNTAIINRHFRIRQVLRAHPGKWINFKYGKMNFVSLPLMLYHNFTGFFPFHLPYSYLRSTFEAVWEKEGAICESSCSHRFREIADISQWLMNYWQMASNNFEPRSIRAGKGFQLHTTAVANSAAAAIRGHKYKMICLNDAIDHIEDFPEICRTVNSALSDVLPQKSAFEI